MRQLDLDRSGHVLLPVPSALAEEGQDGNDPGRECTPAQQDLCDFNRQDWAVLLKLQATGPLPALPAAPAPPIGVPAPGLPPMPAALTPTPSGTGLQPPAPTQVPVPLPAAEAAVPAESGAAPPRPGP
jgi:hypothetical protein